jgi:hypothetical protein
MWRDDSQFDGLQLVGTQKVGAHLRGAAFCGVRPRDSCPLGDRTLPDDGGTRDDPQLIAIGNRLAYGRRFGIFRQRSSICGH